MTLEVLIGRLLLLEVSRSDGEALSLRAGEVPAGPQNNDHEN